MELGLELGIGRVDVGIYDLPGLVFDFDPSFSNWDLEDGEEIKSWESSSVSCPNLVTKGENGPIWVNEGINGLPILRFSGDSVLFSDDEILNGRKSYSIFSVSRYSGPKKGRVISSIDNNWLFGFHQGDHNAFFCGEWLYEGEKEGVENWQIHSAIVDEESSGYGIWNHGNLISEGEMSFNGKYCSIGRLSIGGWKNVDAHCSDCEIARILVFDRALSKIEREYVEKILTILYSTSNFSYSDYLEWFAENGESNIGHESVKNTVSSILIEGNGDMSQISEILKYFSYSESDYHIIKSMTDQEFDPSDSLESCYRGFFLDPSGILANKALIESKEDHGIEVSLTDYCNIIRSFSETGRGEKIDLESMDKIILEMNNNTEPLLGIFEENFHLLNTGRYMQFFSELDRYLTDGVSDFSEIISNRIDAISSENEVSDAIIDLLNQNSESEEVLSYSTEYFKFNKRKSVGGFADRIKGITTVMLLSIVLGRRFEIDWKVPFRIEEIFAPSKYDWRIREHEGDIDKIVLIDSYFSEEKRGLISSESIEDSLGISNKVAEIYCNLFNIDCLENPSSDIDFSNIQELIDQPRLVGTTLSLFDYKPNLSESTIISNFLQFLEKFEDSVAIHFRTGGDGNWEDPVVDSPENVHLIFNYVKKMIRNSGLRTCVYFASDSAKLKKEVLEKYGEELGVFSLNIPISHIDRSQDRDREYGSRFSIMENYLISMCNHILAGKGAYSVISANRKNNWPWRYFKTH